MDNLTKTWLELKTIESAAKNARAFIENQILDLYENEIKEKGTTHLANGLTVQTGQTIQWDDEALDQLAEQEKLGAFKIWPFKTEWKADAKKLEVLKEEEPQQYNIIMTNAATIKSKKPYFTYNDKE